MSNSRLLSVIAGYALPAIAVVAPGERAAACNPDNLLEGEELIQLDVGDGLPSASLTSDYTTRCAVAYIPDTAPDDDRMCILVLHGGQASVDDIKVQTRFRELADEQDDDDGFLVVFPEGLGPLTAGRPQYNWNDGRDVDPANTEEGRPVYVGTTPNDQWAAPIYSHEHDVNDVGYLETLIDVLVSGSLDEDPQSQIPSYRCDPDRVYMVGVSNGGMMTQRFALESSGHRLAAAVSGVANLPKHLAESTAIAPTPLLLMLGRQDVYMRYKDWEDYENDGAPWEPFRPSDSDFDGGWTCAPHGSTCECDEKAGRILSGPATAESWAARNACNLDPEVVEIGDTDVHRYWLECRDDFQVLLYEVFDGGHTWPGNFDYAWWNCAEPALLDPEQEPSDDFSADEESYAFVRDYPVWQRDGMEECVQRTDIPDAHMVVEGFWRTKLRTTNSGEDTDATIRAKALLDQYPLKAGQSLIWRVYNAGAIPPPDRGAGSGWSNAGVSVTAIPVRAHGLAPLLEISVDLSAEDEVLSGSEEQWLEVILPDYDLDDDGYVNFADLGILKAHFFGSNAAYDFNRDGFTNLIDLGMLKSVHFTSVSCRDDATCPVGTCSNYPPPY